MTTLDQLALRIGIEERFLDARGEIRETSPETKRALLAAMGVKAESETEAKAALEALETRQWRRSLPPVRVAYAGGEPVTVDVVVPENMRELHWLLILEDGVRQAGSSPCDRCDAKREIDGRKLERHRIVLSGEIPQGYHRLQSDLDGATCSLIVTPGRCWLPVAAEQGARLWGVATQLYLFRSEKNWGIGDFSDLRKFVELIRESGGDVVGLNPLHAMFLDDPERASPYSPESRLLLNVLNIDVEAVPELADSPETQNLIASEEFRLRLEQCRAASLVDYAAVADLKRQALTLLFERCRLGPDSPRWREFESYREAAGEAYHQSCLFEALRQHFAGITGKLADWHTWPEEYQDPSSPAVARFASEHAGAVTLYAWMQWIADQQLGAAAAAAKKMKVGLYRDLAVGTDSSGAATWSHPDSVVSGAHAGAPPDILNTAGQDWGLPPFHPHVLFETAYRDFIDLVRANMRHAGGLRIDHVMALQHLYWVPNGKPPGEGAYVQYPLEDLVGILALESQRHRCLVVGEDLGTVPEGFRERMTAANVLSYRVLFFEQDKETGAFLPPDSYPRLAVAVTGSHDLPTVRGWWEEVDINVKERLKLFPNESGASEARRQREKDRAELLGALRLQRLLPEHGPVGAEQLVAAVHSFLARTNALLAIAQLDDVTAEAESVNVPATQDEHPNWRRRFSLTIEELAAHPRLRELALACNAERGSASQGVTQEALR